MKFFRILVILLLLATLAIVINRLVIPDRNTAATHFDTLIVLGCPANPDGTPSPEEIERVSEAVREFQAGVAPAMIMTGSAAHRAFTLEVYSLILCWDSF